MINNIKIHLKHFNETLKISGRLLQNTLYQNKNLYIRNKNKFKYYAKSEQV